MLAACEDGYVQAEIGRSAWEFQEQLDRGDRAIVGVTRYTVADDDPGAVPVPRVDPERVQAQIRRVVASRQDRDQARAEAARERIADLDRNPSDNAYGAVIDGVRAGLSHGELVAAMRATFGFGRPLETI
jgi:methylmalonyl-CoA mutase N-terminal domain/subunit